MGAGYAKQKRSDKEMKNASQRIKRNKLATFGKNKVMQPLKFRWQFQRWKRREGGRREFQRRTQHADVVMNQNYQTPCLASLGEFSGWKGKRMAFQWNTPNSSLCHFEEPGCKTLTKKFGGKTWFESYKWQSSNANSLRARQSNAPNSSLCHPLESPGDVNVKD